MDPFFSGVSATWMCLGAPGAQAAGLDGIDQRSLQAPVDPACKAVDAALKGGKFRVGFEVAVFAKPRRLEQRWGAQFTPSKLTANRSLVVAALGHGPAAMEGGQ